MAAQFPDLKGKSVFITGGGAGIGAALTDGFLTQGAQVAFVGRSDATDFVAQMQSKHGRAPLFLRGDITDTALLQASVAQASEAHGTVEILVSNAANDLRHSAESLTPEEWDRLMDVNLKAYFFAAQTVMPGMRALGRGRIVNFSSISYLMGNAGYPAYVAANGGITALTRALAREFGPEGINVNALAPGWVLTTRQKAQHGDSAALAAHLDKQCLKRHLMPEDLVDTVLFLAADGSRMMTGQCLVVDGGVTTTG